MKVTFIRHTRVAVDKGVCYGCSDVETAPTFEVEAAAVKERIEPEAFDAVYSSPLSRCTRLAAFCGFPDALTDVRLKELDFGRWEMKRWDDLAGKDVEAWFADWVHQPAGGAESYEAQFQRVRSFLEEQKNARKKNVCVFTHKGVIACAMVYAGLRPLEESILADIPYGEVVAMEMEA